MMTPQQGRGTSDYEGYGQPLTLQPRNWCSLGTMRHLTHKQIEALLDKETIAHVLVGDGAPSFRGGHRFESWIVGKTVFPEDWTDDEIIGALRVTLAYPAKVIFSAQFFVAFGLVNEVIIEAKVRVSQSSLRLKHAFPVNGTGVFRNDPLGRVPLPLDLSVLEF